MNVLYISGIPAPYRVDLFNEMGKSVHLTVVFLAEYQSDRNKLWQSSKALNFSPVILNKGALSGSKVDFGVVNYLKKHSAEFDVIVFHGYSYVASILAMIWMKLHRINYLLEADGAILSKNESLHKRLIKRFCISNAKYCLSSGRITSDFFSYYGANKDKCIIYPFTSLNLTDIVNAKKFTKNEKELIKEDLGIFEDKYVVVLGNADLLSNKRSELIVKQNQSSINFGYLCFCKDEPIEENNKKISYQKISSLENIDKAIMYKYFASSDAVVLLTSLENADISIYDLLIFGLPVISCEEYLSQDYIRNGNNGIIVKSIDEVIGSVAELLKNDNKRIELSDHCFKELLVCNNSVLTERNFSTDNNVLVANRQLHKQLARRQLNINPDKCIVLYVGRMIYGKGIDVLLNSKRYLPSDINVYLIGGKIDSNSLPSVDCTDDKNIYVFDFMTKEQLRLYYQAADVFVLPTRSDVWGLVVNEALNYGLPVVSTKGCIAACEMLPSDNISQVDDVHQLANRIMYALDSNNSEWQLYAIRKTLEYSIERSADIHVSAFRNAISC